MQTARADYNIEALRRAVSKCHPRPGIVLLDRFDGITEDRPHAPAERLVNELRKVGAQYAQVAIANGRLERAHGEATDPLSFIVDQTDLIYGIPGLS
jgi:hypothetical protein